MTRRTAPRRTPSGRRSKFGAVPCEIDGKRFPSLKEGRRYRELCLLLQAGEIRDLRTQQTYRLDVNGIHICDYRADFVYYDYTKQAAIVEDTKGFKTPEYRLKQKLMLAIHGIEILES